MPRFPLALFCSVALALAVPAADWPQWRGPDRNGMSRETGWLDGWPEGKPPQVAWRVEVGRGHSAVSVARGKAYTLGWDGQKDTVFCLDAKTGKELWKDSYPAPGILQWPGPRATPVVDGDTVFTLSLDGQLRAYDAGNGKPKWQVKLPASYNPDVDYGFAWTPLAEGDLLILPVGKSGAAVRKRDGSFAWGNDGVHGACASPVPYTQDGKRGVAIVTTNPGRDSVAVVGIDPKSGKQLWRLAEWPEKWGAACADPVVGDGKVFVTTAEQHKQGGRFATRPDGTLRPEWSNRNLACYTGAPVLVGGHLYGVTVPGLLRCVEWETGKERWAERGFGDHGSLIAADGKLIVQASSGGKLAVVGAMPDGYEELRTARVFTGKPDTFTPPALANGRIYCRSYAGEVVCLKTGRDQ
jgi:outer membrane protein assembly factor BamB